MSHEIRSLCFGRAHAKDTPIALGAVLTESIQKRRSQMKGIKTLRSVSHLRAVAERAPGENTTRLRVVGLMAMAILLVSVASASPIIGSFNITDTCGAVPGCTSGVTVGATTIDWFPPVGPPNGSFVVGGTSGGFSATGPFGNFTGLTGF